MLLQEVHDFGHSVDAVQNFDAFIDKIFDEYKNVPKPKKIEPFKNIEYTQEYIDSIDPYCVPIILVKYLFKLDPMKDTIRPVAMKSKSFQKFLLKYVDAIMDMRNV